MADTRQTIEELYHKPLLDLVFQAAQIHRENFQSQKIQVSELISIKTGGCPEDCSYCPQAARYNAVNKHRLLEVEEVRAQAEEAKARGASRLCLGAAWRSVKNGKDFDRVLEMVQAVSATGMEVCTTLGMLDEAQAAQLKEAGLYAYNHNLDTSAEHYKEIISTRTYNDRLKTIKAVQKAGLSLCCGGIIGLGESEADRIDFLYQLTQLDPQPDSVPINALVPVKGTPLEDQKKIEPLTHVRIVACARIVLPKAVVRLSAGRKDLSKEAQALCFLAGANSIFTGEKLLTTPNPSPGSDQELFSHLGLKACAPYEQSHA